MSDQKLKKRLCAQARAAGYDHAYIIRKFDDELNNSYALYFVPLVVCKVDVRTGEETYVNGVMESVDFSDFMRLSASSKWFFPYNLMVVGNEKPSRADFSPLLGVPCSVIVPHLLYFDRLKLYPEK